MRRAASLRPTTILLGGLVLAALAGCGNRGDHTGTDSGLTFEQLVDTTGLSGGPAIVESFDAYRMPGGSLRVKVRVRLPEGTMVGIAVRTPGAQTAVATTQAFVRDGVIESPPMMSPDGPLPVAPYRFELTAQFTTAWQSPRVLRETNDGRSLRGPGITRTRSGGAVFTMAEEMTR